MKMFSECLGKCCICASEGGCLAGHGDNDFSPATNEQIIKRLDKGEFLNDRDRMIKDLETRGIVYNVREKFYKIGYSDAKADTVRDIEIKFAMHFGTYTGGDTIKVSEVFKLLSKFAEEMLEGEI
jgi:hypothetical protein